MGTGYTRQASAGIVDGFIVEASDLNAEFNRIEAAFNGTTGHAHDGTTGNGPQIDLTTSVTGILPDSHLPGTITDPREFDDLVTFNAGATFPNASTSANGITLSSGINQTQIGADGVFARNGGNMFFRPNGAASSSNQATLTTAGLFTAVSLAGAGSGITAINASNLASGTVPSARVSGSYTGITGTGALNAGSITSGFGNINIGTSTFTGNGSGLNTLNASELDSGTIPNARFPSTLPAASGANLTNLNASNLSSGTVPSARISGSYTGISGVGTLTNTDLLVLKGSAIVGTGASGIMNGGISNLTAGGTGSLAVFAESGTISFRPNGRTSSTNQATLNTNGVLALASGSPALTIGTGTGQTQIASSGIFARNGGVVYLRPNGVGSATGEVTVSTSGVLSADSITTGLINVSSNSVNHGYLGRSSNNPWSFRWGGSSGGLYVGGSSNNNFIIATSSDPSSNRVFYIDALQVITYEHLNVQDGMTLLNSISPGDTNPMLAAYYGASGHSPVIDYWRNFSGGNPTTTVMRMRHGTPAGTEIGSISCTNTVTSYNTTSDERMKDFIGNYDPDKAIEIIRADPVRDFTWKSTGDYAVGWGAQTSYAVSSDLATKPDNEDEAWGIDQGKRTPYLWAAMSKVLDRIDELEARIAELEAE